MTTEKVGNLTDSIAGLTRALSDRYTIERELGGGGMSRVFLAHEVRLSRKVVVKVLTAELAQGLNAERFEREILLAASLQQANIVPVLATGDVDGLPWFTMPFVEGESLRARLAGQQLPITDVIAILRDITKALAYAHARNVVHRDIKPDNVLLSGGTAVVTDFGIAKAISIAQGDADRSGLARSGATLTQVGTSIGTPAYMAPEQVAGDPRIDHRVDLYALGCVAYELLTSRSPFADLPPQRMLAAHLSAIPVQVAVLRADCPPALAHLVMSLLQKDPADRPASATEVLRALDSVVTTSSPTLALSRPGSLARILGLYMLATAAVALVARAAVVSIGLPDWVFPGAMSIMALGLPALLFTAYAKRVARRAARATPTLTPGGSSQPATVGTMATLALRAHPHLSWRRTARSGVVAMGVFVLLVVAFMTLRARGIGPWGSLVAAGKLRAQDRIVLADLKAPPGDSALAPIVVEAVRAALSQSNAVHLVGVPEIANALEQMKQSRNTRLDNDTLVHQVAARTNAKAVLGGRLAPAGNGYAISLELTAADGGAVLASYQATANTDDLLQVVDGLTRKLRSRVGESLKQVRSSVPLQQATTTSLEALRKFSEASIANDVESDFPRAEVLAREAVKLDSTFALAWRKLAVIESNHGASVLSVDSALTQAIRYSDRLPDREKYLVRGMYYESSLAGADRGKSGESYRQVLAVDSTNISALNQLGVNMELRQRFDSAAHYFDKQRHADPNPAASFKYVVALAEAGHAAAARRTYDSVLRTAPEAGTLPVAVLSKMTMLAVLNLDDSLMSTAAAMKNAASLAERLSGRVVYRAMMLTHGRFRQASHEDSALMVFTAENKMAPSFPLALPAAAIIWLGKPSAGVAMLDSIVNGDGWKSSAVDDRPYSNVVMLYALAGRPDRAQAMLTQFLSGSFSAKSPAMQPVIESMRGEIALSSGKTDEALKNFRAAAVDDDGDPVTCSGCAYFALGRAYDRANAPDSAIAYFERYLAIPRAWRSLSAYGASDDFALATVQKRLGELYDQKHDNRNALAHYGDFVNLWKNGDPEALAVVATVRKRMGELAAEEGNKR